MNYLLLKENNQLNLFLYKKYNDDVISSIELNWCNEEVKILAPERTVKIPSIICKIIIKPKIITGLYKYKILFLKVIYDITKYIIIIK